MIKNSDEKIISDNNHYKKKMKEIVSLRYDYDIWEIIEILLLNDFDRLDELIARCKQLTSAYNYFVEEIESGDEDRRKIAIGSFKRPPK